MSVPIVRLDRNGKFLAFICCFTKFINQEIITSCIISKFHSFIRAMPVSKILAHKFPHIPVSHYASTR